VWPPPNRGPRHVMPEVFRRPTGCGGRPGLRGFADCFCFFLRWRRRRGDAGIAPDRPGFVRNQLKPLALVSGPPGPDNLMNLNARINNATNNRGPVTLISHVPVLSFTDFSGADCPSCADHSPLVWAVPLFPPGKNGVQYRRQTHAPRYRPPSRNLDFRNMTLALRLNPPFFRPGLCRREWVGDLRLMLPIEGNKQLNCSPSFERDPLVASGLVPLLLGCPLGVCGPSGAKLVFARI